MTTPRKHLSAVAATITSWLACMSLVSLLSAVEPIRARIVVESKLEYRNTPLDPSIDFAHLIRMAGQEGSVDPASIQVRNLSTGKNVTHAVGEDLAYGESARIAWVNRDPRHREFELLFQTAERRPPSTAPALTPQIGVGDLLRYNAGRPMPITVCFTPGLDDIDGDGLLDLTGAWNYAHRPGRPWDGVFCYPRVNSPGLEFGELTRLRYESGIDDPPKFFSHIYMACDFADWNQDGRLDLVVTRRGASTASLYLNLGTLEPSGMPRFGKELAVPAPAWQACRAVDLDQDGVTDLVVDGRFIRNSNSKGWPFRAAPAVQLDAGKQPCFLDIDDDGRLDSFCLWGGKTVQPDFYKIVVRRNLGGDPPRFGDEETLPGVDAQEISSIASWRDGERSGLLVQHDAFQSISVYRLVRDPPRLVLEGKCASKSARLALGDQAWPCLCDWDDDGDLDLLVGGGYGWPRIVINEGTRKRPAFSEATRIASEGKPIRFVRDEILGDPANWHNMGYPYPLFEDWDGDGLRDLICPNETNRILWFRNIGSASSPQFGPRRQILCDGYPDSNDLRRLSATRALDPKSNNGVYPYEKERPFFWRTGAAVADFDGDGLADLVTHDGHTRKATLFTQYRSGSGTLKLKKQGPLRLATGEEITDAIVDRRAHWTESFRAADWDQDGLLDLIYSVAGAHSGTRDGGSIYLLRNVGSASEPRFARPQTMRCFGEPIRITNHGPHPWAGDFDGDGSPDLVACVEWSVYAYYNHAALSMRERPTFRITLSSADERD